MAITNDQSYIAVAACLYGEEVTIFGDVTAQGITDQCLLYIVKDSECEVLLSVSVPNEYGMLGMKLAFDDTRPFLYGGVQAPDGSAYSLSLLIINYGPGSNHDHNLPSHLRNYELQMDSTSYRWFNIMPMSVS